MSPQEFAPRALELAEDQPSLPAIVEPLSRLRAKVVKQLDVLHRRALEMVRDCELCRRWMAIPEAGPVVASTFQSAIDLPGRFVKSRSVGPIPGLAPSKHQSGEVNRHGRIITWTDHQTRRRDDPNPVVRGGKYHAGSRPVPLAQSQGLKTRRHRGYKLAKVALDRKLAVVMHHMRIDGSALRWSALDAAWRSGAYR